MSTTLRIPGLCGVLLLSTAVMPVQGDILDRVENKVNAIKNETATIKNKTTKIQTSVSETASTVSAQIAELEELKATLDKLKSMKDTFAGGGFDPSELLEMVDFEQLKASIDDMKQRRQEFQALLSDSGLETYRADFLEMMAGINTIVAENDVVEITPLQTLIQKAPPPILAILKAATEPVFAGLKEEVTSAAKAIKQLRKEVDLTSPDPYKVCRIANIGGTSLLWVKLWDLERRLKKVRSYWSQMLILYEGKTADIPDFPSFGVHGYFHFEFGDKGVTKGKNAMRQTINRLDRHISSIDDFKTLLQWFRDDSGGCELLTPST